MDLSGSVHKMFRVAAATGVLLVFACLQAGPADCANAQFTETWKQQNQCKDIPTKTCRTFGGGSFNFSATFPATSCTPSDLDTGSGEFIEFGLTDGTTGSGSDSTGGFESIDNSVDDFALKVFKDHSVATLVNSVRICNPPNSNCKFVNFEKVKVTIDSKGNITISGSATTGFNFNGDMFENSIDALNFVGKPTGDITDTVILSFSISTSGSVNCFESGDIPVAVTGTVKTSKETSTKPALSTIKLKGKL